MVSEKMVAWGSQGCVIRDLAAYGEQRAAVVGAENVFNFTIGNPSVPAPSCVRQTIEHLLQTVPAEQLHAYTAAPGLASVRAKMAAYLEKTFGVGYRAEDVYMTCLLYTSWLERRSYTPWNSRPEPMGQLQA